MAKSKNTINGITPVDNYVDDDGYSSNAIFGNMIYGAKDDPYQKAPYNDGNTIYTGPMHSAKLFRRDEIDLFNKTYRFGLYNPYGQVNTTREFVFFTKPDLHILQVSDTTGRVENAGVLNDGLKNEFWRDMLKSKRRIIDQLQSSASTSEDPFIHLLQNQISSPLEIPGISAQTIDTAVNMYGVGFSYRGSSEDSDDNPEFSIEFKDDRWLNTYYFFKAYEEYETEKHHGTIRPWKKYIVNKIIHDQFSIYKFIVDEDMETILYYGKYYGVMPLSLPRDVFSSDGFTDGLKYNINFKAAFYEDMKPEILQDYNDLIDKNNDGFYSRLSYDIDIYNQVTGRSDGRPAQAAKVFKETHTPRARISPNGYVYKLKWKGSDKV